MIYKISVPHDSRSRFSLLSDIIKLPGVKDFGEDHEFIFRADINLQEEIAKLAYKYTVNAGWIGEEGDSNQTLT